MYHILHDDIEIESIRNAKNSDAFKSNPFKINIRNINGNINNKINYKLYLDLYPKGYDLTSNGYVDLSQISFPSHQI